MNPKRFLFVSNEALIIDTAWSVKREGHDVRFFIQNEEEADIGDGFVPKTRDWKADVDWADVIVFDDVLGRGRDADALRKRGKAVVGGTPFTDRLEDDRAFGQEIMKSSGISILPYQTFTSFDEAIAYVRAHPDYYVIKPSGDAQNTKHLLFVGNEEDGEDVIDILQSYKNVWRDTIKTFQLQKRATGVEVAVGAFFNGGKFVEPININFEHKKLFPGNIGPATGEMGTSMFWSEPNRLFHATLKKLEPILARENFVGYMDINCIVNGNGIYPLEFTARFGYPTISIQEEGMLTPIGEFLCKIAHGEDPKLKTRRGFQVGVRLRLPPYPFKDQQAFDSYTRDATVVFKNKKKSFDGIHIEDIKEVNGEWVLAGSSGAALVVAGIGTTMKQAQQQAYTRIQNILIPNMYYRTDIGDRWNEDADRLHSWGYLHEV